MNVNMCTCLLHCSSVVISAFTWSTVHSVYIIILVHVRIRNIAFGTFCRF